MHAEDNEKTQKRRQFSKITYKSDVGLLRNIRNGEETIGVHKVHHSVESKTECTKMLLQFRNRKTEHIKMYSAKQINTDGKTPQKSI